uniref:Ovule protein n=1 Tax=Mesocestoides corti TaxID=53468 RepID=A0A5K3G528_MESCO
DIQVYSSLSAKITPSVCGISQLTSWSASLAELRVIVLRCFTGIFHSPETSCCLRVWTTQSKFGASTHPNLRPQLG